MMAENVSDLQKNIINFLKVIGGSESQCRSCGAVIWWIMTKNKKSAPVNGDLTSHFATCPQSQRWRKDQNK